MYFIHHSDSVFSIWYDKGIKFKNLHGDGVFDSFANLRYDLPVTNLFCYFQIWDFVSKCFSSLPPNQLWESFPSQGPQRGVISKIWFHSCIDISREAFHADPLIQGTKDTVQSFSGHVQSSEWHISLSCLDHLFTYGLEDLRANRYLGSAWQNCTYSRIHVLILQSSASL